MTAPFTMDARDPAKVRSFLNDLNRPTFLERSVSVALHDTMLPSIGEEGIIPTDSLASQTPGIVASQTNATALGTTAFAKDVLRAVLFKQGHAFRMSTFGFAVTTGVASSSARIGIYDCLDDLHGNLYPNRCLFRSAANISTSGTGAKTESPALDLEPNRAYWAVYNAGDGGSGVATINSLPVASAGVGVGTGSGTPTPYITVASAFGALPNYFPSGAVVATTVPPMLYREYEGSSGHSRTDLFPLFTPTTVGYTLRRAYLLRSTDSQAETGKVPYNLIRFGVGTSAGFRTLATFDTRSNAQKARIPYLYYPGPDIPLGVGDSLEVQVDSVGWPKRRIVGTTVQADYIYTGAN